ncbi:hypothetical protein BDC45DRAFT_351636 [Circinella umbellata]|nr:hypothetical protein BDC45DRAFT_351636 [Circinella umbellata]
MSTECLLSSNVITTITTNNSIAEQLSASNTTSSSNPSSICHINSNNRSNNLESELTTLAATGNLLGLRERIEDNTIQVDPDQSQSGTGLRPLHFAASRGFLNIVTCLIEKAGATVDATDKEGEVNHCKKNIYINFCFLFSSFSFII